ncbi:hypothetical protein TNCV_4100571 [Trichonephila clavipes]|nr:hypothetical protein TNCV_4100571 [Trichonephila clavipes]
MNYKRAKGCNPRQFQEFLKVKDTEFANVTYTKFICRNCGGGDRGRVAIYRPFGEFLRAKIALSPVWCSRPTTGVPLALATMNFVGLDLTTSDRWEAGVSPLLSIGWCVPEETAVGLVLQKRGGRFTRWILALML